MMVLNNETTKYAKRNKTGLEITPISESKNFPKAKLDISRTTIKVNEGESVKLIIDYSLSNFKLTNKTKDEKAQLMANAQKGEHIHFILDNAPYQALYKLVNYVMLKKGVTD